MSDEQVSAESFRPGIGANRAAFDVPDGVAYFNTANLSPHLRAVRAAGEVALTRRGRPWTIREQDWFDDAERARELFGRIVGASGESIACIPATSYGFAVAARNLDPRPGQRILVLAEEYPSGIYTWREVAARTGAELLTVSREPGQPWTEAVLAELDDRVAIVSVPNVHWTDGARLDLTAIGERTQAVGARLVVDASQSAGALPLDVRAIHADFVMSVGYKWLLGPFGLGYLYVADEHLDGVPIEQNWILRRDSQDFARLTDYRDEYQPGARRFDVGERTNFETMPMAVAALEQLCEWDIDNVRASLADVTDTIAAAAQSLGLVVPAPDERAAHMLGISIPEQMRSVVLAAFDAAECYAAIRAGSLRVAPHLHVNARDIDTLTAALARGVTGGRATGSTT